MFTPRDGTTLREAATRTIALLKETVTHPDRSIAIVMLEAQHLQYAQSIMLGAYSDSLRQEVESGSVEKREQRTIGCFCEVSVIHLTNIVTKIEPSEFYWRQLKTFWYRTNVKDCKIP